LDATGTSVGTIALQYTVIDEDFCRTIDTLLITVEEMTAAAVTNIICDNNGTNDDPTDDTFTFTLHVTGTVRPIQSRRTDGAFPHKWWGYRCEHHE